MDSIIDFFQLIIVTFELWHYNLTSIKLGIANKRFQDCLRNKSMKTIL